MFIIIQLTWFKFWIVGELITHNSLYKYVYDPYFTYFSPKTCFGSTLESSPMEMIVVLFLNMVWSEMIKLFGKCSRRHFHSACNGLENIILYIFILCQCQVHKSTAEKVIVCGVHFFQHHRPQTANVCKVQSQMSRLVTMFVNNCQICKDSFLYYQNKMQYCMLHP